MRCAHKAEADASKAGKDVDEEVVQMQNIVKCFSRQRMMDRELAIQYHCVL